MKSPDSLRRTLDPQQTVELASTHNHSKTKIRHLAAAVTALSVMLSACGTVKASPERATTPTSAIHAKDIAPKPIQSTTTSELPTTATTVALEMTSPSGKFIGALELLRKGPHETKGSSDLMVVHRLNNGIWTPTKAGMAVNPNPMLNYGPVYIQNTAPFGTQGETSLIAAHDVTPIDAPVTINGSTYNQSVVTHSMNASPNLTNPNGGIGNMEIDDQIIIYLNQPDNTEKVLTYTINKRYIIDPNDAQQVQALANPQESLSNSDSQLTYYDCWTPGSANYREVFNAILKSTNIVPGNASYPGIETPQLNTLNQ